MEGAEVEAEQPVQQAGSSLAYGFALSGLPSSSPLNKAAFEPRGSLRGLPVYREAGGGRAGAYWSAASSAWHFHHAYTEQAAEANAAVARIACAAAEPAAGAPLPTGWGLRAETYDHGKGWKRVAAKIEPRAPPSAPVAIEAKELTGVRTTRPNPATPPTSPLQALVRAGDAVAVGVAGGLGGHAEADDLDAQPRGRAVQAAPRLQGRAARGSHANPVILRCRGGWSAAARGSRPGRRAVRQPEGPLSI